MGRRRKKEKPNDRIAFYTKTYFTALVSRVWKVERRFASDIMEAVRKLKLKLKLDSLTRYGSNSFIYSILLQLKRQDIYSGLDEKSKHLADRFSHVLFRRKLSDFMIHEKQGKIDKLKKEFAEHKDPSGEAPPPWESYWEGMKQSKHTNYWYERAAAIFLQMDIKLVEISGMKSKPYVVNYIVGSDSLEDKGDHKCLIIGVKTDLYYQSLLPNIISGMDSDDEEEEEDNVEEKEEEKCPNCEKSFLHLLKHIAGNKSCKEKLDQKYVSELKKKAEIRHKEESTERKRRSRKRKKVSEDYEERESRLALQSYYQAKSREKKRKLDPEGTTKEEKEIRAKNRSKQRSMKIKNKE